MEPVLRPVVVAGPSGVGKVSASGLCPFACLTAVRQSTNIQRLMAEMPGKYAFSVSHTTRLPRPGETDGVQYHFVTQDRFKV